MEQQKFQKSLNSESKSSDSSLAVPILDFRTEKKQTLSKKRLPNSKILRDKRGRFIKYIEYVDKDNIFSKILENPIIECRCGCRQTLYNKSLHYNYQRIFIKNHQSIGRTHIGKKGCKFNGEVCPNCGNIHPNQCGENNVSKRLEVRGKIKENAKNNPNFGMKGKTFKHSEKTKRKISLKHKGKHFSEQSRLKMGLAKKGIHPITEFKKGCSTWNKGKKGCYSQEVLDSISNSQKKRFKDNPSLLIDMGIRTKKLWKNPEYKKKMLSEEVRMNKLKGLLKRPTSFEQRIGDLCFRNNLPFLYRGNGGFLINFKNPDFVNEKDKIVIEVFYSYFKIRDYGSVENYKEFCRKKYEPAGWKVIFLDENEVLADNWEEICLNKIMEILPHSLS